MVSMASTGSGWGLGSDAILADRSLSSSSAICLWQVKWVTVSDAIVQSYYIPIH